MQFDRRTLDRLLQMNDRQLAALVEKLATEYGLDLSAFHVREGDMASLRQALRTATDEDLARLGEQFQSGRQG